MDTNDANSVHMAPILFIVHLLAVRNPDSGERDMFTHGGEAGSPQRAQQTPEAVNPLTHLS